LPPPGGAPAHNLCCSGRHCPRIISARRGSIGRIGPSGATAGAGLGADADPLAAADVAAGVVGARVPVVFFRVGAAAGVFVAGGAAAAGGVGAEESLGLGGVAAVGAGAAAPEAGVAIALTALRQGGDNLGSLRPRHAGLHAGAIGHEI